MLPVIDPLGGLNEIIEEGSGALGWDDLCPPQGLSGSEVIDNGGGCTSGATLLPFPGLCGPTWVNLERLLSISGSFSHLKRGDDEVPAIGLFWGLQGRTMLSA